jgi:hypothetical protein
MLTLPYNTSNPTVGDEVLIPRLDTKIVEYTDCVNVKLETAKLDTYELLETNVEFTKDDTLPTVVDILDS